MKAYLQGDTIAFYVRGIEGVDFDQVDFTVLIYRGNGCPEEPPVVITKAGAEPQQQGHYRCVIPSLITKTMIPGAYTAEILVQSAGGVNRILKAPVLSIAPSKSKERI